MSATKTIENIFQNQLIYGVLTQNNLVKNRWKQLFSKSVDFWCFDPEISGLFSCENRWKRQLQRRLRGAFVYLEKGKGSKNQFSWTKVSFAELGLPHRSGESRSRLRHLQPSGNLHKNQPKTRLDSKTCDNRLLQIMAASSTCSIFTTTVCSIRCTVAVIANKDHILTSEEKDPRLFPFADSTAEKNSLISVKQQLTQQFNTKKINVKLQNPDFLHNHISESTQCRKTCLTIWDSHTLS